MYACSVDTEYIYALEVGRYIIWQIYRYENQQQGRH